MEKHGDMEIHFIIKLLRGYLQKVGCNKKYKCTEQCHYRLLCTLSKVSHNYFLYKHGFNTKKKVIEAIQYLESFLNSR